MVNETESILARVKAIEEECKQQRAELATLSRLLQKRWQCIANSLHGDKSRFDRLAAEWRQEESPSSSARDLATHPAYQQIIGMGQ